MSLAETRVEIKGIGVIVIGSMWGLPKIGVITPNHSKWDAFRHWNPRFWGTTILGNLQVVYTMDGSMVYCESLSNQQKIPVALRIEAERWYPWDLSWLKPKVNIYIYIYICDIIVYLSNISLHIYICSSLHLMLKPWLKPCFSFIIHTYIYIYIYIFVYRYLMA